MNRAWSVVGTTMATQLAQAGLLIYGFSALALPLEREFGTTRVEVMIAATCLSLASSIFAPLAGRWVDRRSVRALMICGAAALAAGFALVAAARSLWQVWLAYAVLLPFANVLLGQLTSATLVTRWFDRHRGRAMGLSAMGTSLGGFVFPIVIATGTEALGWRTTILCIGLSVAVLLAALIWLGVRDRPDAGSSATTRGVPADPDNGETTWQILSRAAFWIIALGVGIKIATYFALINNLGGLADDIGVGAVAAAGMVSLLSLTSMAGKLGFGVLAERFSPRALFVTTLVLTIASFAILLAAGDLAALSLACLLLGLATGGMLPLWSLIVGDYFEPGSFGRALGLTNLAMVPLTASASPLAGWAHDRTGSYDAAIWASMAALAIAAGLLAFLPGGRRRAS